MNKHILIVVSSAIMAVSGMRALAADEQVEKYIPIIRENIYSSYQGMFREKGDAFKYPFLAPGSAQYKDILWDWDSWLSDVARRQILLEKGNDDERRKALAYEQGCVRNYLSYGGMD